MKKIIASIILFGSLWGFLESSLGDWLHEYNVSVLMATLAIFIMAVTRIHYNLPGMQLGMALVAGLLHHFNPVGTCLICSSIAILMEGVVFEIIWALPWKNHASTIMRMGMGVISFYCIYAAGYITTQILTPALTATFYVEDLLGVIPRIFFQSSLSALIGMVALPFAFTIRNLNISIKESISLPATLMLTAGFWAAVITGI